MRAPWFGLLLSSPASTQQQTALERTLPEHWVGGEVDFRSAVAVDVNDGRALKVAEVSPLLRNSRLRSGL